MTREQITHAIDYDPMAVCWPALVIFALAVLLLGGYALWAGWRTLISDLNAGMDDFFGR